jgi:5-(carboxyamino)imidazole ribonucleotide synthase
MALEAVIVPPGGRVGILGGGQLGRMLALAAARLGINVQIYTDSADGPAQAVAASTRVGSYTDVAALTAFAAGCDVVTYEFENIPLDAIDAVLTRAPVYPPPQALRVAQDRLVEKRFMRDLGLATAPFAPVDSDRDLAAAIAEIGLPAVLKTRRLGYDGKGQTVIRTLDEAGSSLEQLGFAPAILEGLVPLAAELSVIGVRSRDGIFASYDCPTNSHRGGILHSSTVPSGLPPEILVAARNMALQIAEALDYVGVIGVELFLHHDGRLLINEIAPRVHNSGHWTQDTCLISQFENHIRAIAGWPLGTTSRHSDAEMINLLGDDVADWHALAGDPSVALHLYGKRQAQPGRKMGHLTKVRPISQ